MREHGISASDRLPPDDNKCSPATVGHPQSFTFEFDTFGMHFDAQVSEYVPKSRLGWFGKGPDVEAYQTWLLAPLASGCQVITEEVAKGPVAIGIRKSDSDAMHKGHELWLTSLKQLSEK